MMDFGTKELEALALIEPETEDNYFRSTNGMVLKNNVTAINFVKAKLIGWWHDWVRAYQRFLEHEAAKAKLYRMSDRELCDIGIARSEIDQRVTSAKRKAEKNKSQLIAAIFKKLKAARKARVTYVHLMRMENRQLADIGLTRGEINAALLGKKTKFANTNLKLAGNDNDHRRAG